MTIEEYNKNLNGVIRDLQTGSHGEIMIKMAVEALTMIKQRVQQTGTDAKGSKYAPYSTKPMLVGCKSFKVSVCKELFANKEKRKKLDWRTIGSGADAKRLAILQGGYKRWRELMLGAGHGDIVNFSVTNAMWNDINVISKQSDHQRGIAIIGAKQEIEKKKLAGNTKRRGDILDLSQKEINQLRESYNIGVLKIFRQNGL